MTVIYREWGRVREGWSCICNLPAVGKIVRNLEISAMYIRLTIIDYDNIHEWDILLL